MKELDLIKKRWMEELDKYNSGVNRIIQNGEYMGPYVPKLGKEILEKLAVLEALEYMVKEKIEFSLGECGKMDYAEDSLSKVKEILKKAQGEVK